MDDGRLPPPSDRILRMPRLNEARVAARLVRDPDMAMTAAGQAVANLRIAVNSTYKTAQGEQRQKSTYMRVTAHGRVAEFVEANIKKGDPVVVIGTLENIDHRFEGMTAKNPAQLLAIRAVNVMPLEQDAMK